uniref:ATP synthase F0 subunit 8 n=1 Tax=Tettigarcta crinita TaxID=295286 RepID=A0A3S5GL09_9HEMI|nr:ATP synthase F0 subunit 8 [Tettigarcta crinita]
MSPMYWIILFMYFNCIVMMLMFVIYFNYTNIPKFNKNEILKFKNNWMW